jgi:hypothetical protein
MNIKTTIFALLLLATAMLNPSNKVFGSDLRDDQYASLSGLVDRIVNQSKISDATLLSNGILSRDGVSVSAFDKLQLGYTLVYMVENGIDGNRTEALFEEFKRKVGNIMIPHYIMFFDEREKLLEALAKDAQTNYGSSNKIASSDILSKTIGMERSFFTLVYEAQIRLEKKNGYKFKNKEFRGYQ